MKAFGNIYSDQRTVQPGTPEVFEIPKSGRTKVAVNAGVANPANVEFTCSPPPTIKDGTALWFTWPAGQVSAPTIDGSLATLTAVRVTATLQPVEAAVAV